MTNDIAQNPAPASPVASDAPKADDAHLNLDEFLCFSVYAAAHAFNRVYKPLLDELGLTYPQYLVMVALWGEDRQTVRGIGNHLHLESSTLTPLIKRLETAGLVKRERDNVDERQVRVGLTDAGRELRDRATCVPGCVFEATGMELDELIDLNNKLRLLRDKLESYRP